MLNVKQDVVRELSAVLPCYYELLPDSTTTFPCITYLENKNSVNKNGSTLGYSDIEFTIKLWAYTVTDMETYLSQIDDKMRSLGYTRYNATELIVDDMIEKVMYYKALGLERFN